MGSSNGAGAGLGLEGSAAVTAASAPEAAGGTRLPGNSAHPAGPRGYTWARPGRLRARAPH